MTTSPFGLPPAPGGRCWSLGDKNQRPALMPDPVSRGMMQLDCARRRASMLRALADVEVVGAETPARTKSADKGPPGPGETPPGGQGGGGSWDGYAELLTVSLLWGGWLQRCKCACTRCTCIHAVCVWVNVGHMCCSSMHPQVYTYFLRMWLLGWGVRAVSCPFQHRGSVCCCCSTHVHVYACPQACTIQRSSSSMLKSIHWSQQLSRQSAHACPPSYLGSPYSTSHTTRKTSWLQVCKCVLAEAVQFCVTHYFLYHRIACHYVCHSVTAHRAGNAMLQ